jgi:hypothetical protein
VDLGLSSDQPIVPLIVTNLTVTRLMPPWRPARHRAKPCAKTRAIWVRPLAGVIDAVCRVSAAAEVRTATYCSARRRSLPIVVSVG